jgi:hypothetical protein
VSGYEEDNMLVLGCILKTALESPEYPQNGFYVSLSSDGDLTLDGKMRLNTVQASIVKLYLSKD